MRLVGIQILGGGFNVVGEYIGIEKEQIKWSEKAGCNKWSSIERSLNDVTSYY